MIEDSFQYIQCLMSEKFYQKAGHKEITYISSVYIECISPKI